MHVADITMFYAAQSGGVRRYLDTKRVWLRASRCTHTLFIPTAPDTRPDPWTIGLRSAPLPFSHGYRVPLGNRAAVTALVESGPEVIEAADPYQLAWGALRAARQLRVPAVAYCHSDLPRLVGTQWGAGSERLASRYLRELYNRFDAVLAPSRSMTQRLRDWGIRASRQPLGVDLDTFAPARRSGQLRAGLGIGPDIRLLIYAGRFSPEKHLDVLFEAVCRLGPRYALLIAGAGRLPATIPANVIRLSFIPDSLTLARHMADCDAFVHAGDQETFGLGVLEALACGLPVVGVDAGGVAEAVPPDAGILVSRVDAKTFAEAIEALFERDPELLRKSARAAAAQYGWDRVFARMLRRYRALIAAGARSASLKDGPVKRVSGAHAPRAS
jgi:alpha-1,6-mannosyltransferase